MANSRRSEPFHAKAYSMYGASMGRRSDHISAFEGATNGRLRRVPLDSGGYDPGGAYWGTPSNLWCATADSVAEEVVTHYLRAPSREAAKARFPKNVQWKR